MAKATHQTSGNAVAAVIALVEAFEAPDRIRILRTVSAYFAGGSEAIAPFGDSPTVQLRHSVPFSRPEHITPKQFMVEKRPQTDVERVACLAYFLTHHRDVAQFKTVDVTKVNTEAAQVRFSNASLAVANALKCGYLAHASKAHKQLSALGEQYVQALPDRQAAKALLAQAGTKRRSRAKKSTSRSS